MKSVWKINPKTKNNMEKIVILDNGHGIETPGKRSPVWADKTQLFEWEFNRDMVARIVLKCYRAGIRAVKLVPETSDVSLAERCKRANMWYDRCNGECVVLSIHANAGGGTGFEVFTSPGETKADEIATALIEQLQQDFPEIKIRKDLADGDPDKEANFYILKHTKAPAILAENLFMDSEQDCRLLLTEDFRERLADSYVEFLKKIV